MRILIVFCLLIGYLNTTGCQDASKENKNNESISKSDELNNEAMNLLQTKTDTNTMVQALYILDKAVALDSSNYAAYNNMMGVLLRLKKMDKANTVLDQLIAQTNIPNYSLFKGFILERHYNDSIQANKYYLQAYTQLDSLYKSGMQDEELLINRLLAQFMTYGQEDALQGLDSLISKEGKLPSIEHLKNAIINNDRTAILNGAY